MCPQHDAPVSVAPETGKERRDNETDSHTSKETRLDAGNRHHDHCA